MTQHKPKPIIYNPHKRRTVINPVCGQCSNFVEAAAVTTLDGRTLIKPSHCRFIYTIDSDRYLVDANSNQAQQCLFFDPDCPF